MKFPFSNAPPKTQQPQPMATDAIDPGILEMGTSVSVNDERRRAVTTECQEIKAVCIKLESDINAEEATATELLKSKRHADAELASLMQGATECLETINVSTQVFRRLQNTFETTIVINRPTLTQAQSQHAAGGDPMTPSEQSLSVPSPTSTIMEIQESTAEKQKAITSMAEDMDNKLETLKYYIQRKAEVESEQRAVLARIKADKLELRLVNAKHQTRLAEDELEDDTNRIKMLQEKRATIDARNAAFRKMIAEGNEALNAEKKANDLKEQQMHARIAALEAERCREEKEIADLERENALLDKQLAQVEATAREAVQLLAQRDQETKKLEQERFCRNNLFAKQAEISAEITTVTKKIEHDKRAIIQEEAKALAVAETKAANDKLDVEKTVNDIKETKAKLEELEALLADGTCPEKDKLVIALETQKNKLAQLKVAVKAADEELEGKKSTLKELYRIVDDHKDAYDKKFESVKALLAEELETKAALERQIEQQELECQQKAFSDESAYHELMRKTKVYRFGAKLLLRTKEKEAKLAEAEALAMVDND